MISRARPQPALVSGMQDEEVLELARNSRHAVVRLVDSTRTIPEIGLAAVDFSPVSIDAARLLFQLLPERSTLYLLHVIQAVDDTHGAIAEVDRMDGEQETAGRGHGALSLRHAFDDLKHSLHDERRQVRIVELWRCGTLDEQLDEIARTHDVEMIAIGYNARERTDGEGNLVQRVLHSTDLPVLVVPARPVVATPMYRGARMGDWQMVRNYQTNHTLEKGERSCVPNLNYNKMSRANSVGIL